MKLLLASWMPQISHLLKNCERGLNREGLSGFAHSYLEKNKSSPGLEWSAPIRQDTVARWPQGQLFTLIRHATPSSAAHPLTPTSGDLPATVTRVLLRSPFFFSS